jgi:cell division protein FtsZ
MPSKSKSKAKRKLGRPDDAFIPLTNIKVVGVGGAGGNAVSRMAADFPRGVEFIAINTDHQDLDHCEVRKKIYIGKNLTKGLGAGMNPDLGRQAAEENRSEIAEALSGADLVFITAGMGGGTGTGAGPIVAEVAKQSGALTIAVVTRPFVFEGTQRERIAAEGVGHMKEKVDALIVVPNDRIFSVIDKDTSIKKAFEAIDEVLRNALQGIVELIMTHGNINVDFADIKAIVQDAGLAIVGVGVASGQDRAVNAVNAALHSPLLVVSAEGAHGIVLAISGGADLKMTEINDAAKLVAQTVDPSAKIIFGTYHDRRLKPNQIKITLVATGFANSNQSNSLFQSPAPFTSPRTYMGEDRPLRAIPLEERAEASSSFRKQIQQAQSQPQDEPRDSFKETPKFSSSVRPGIFGPKDEAEEDDGGASPWDIPTFLRKKKK